METFLKSMSALGTRQRSLTLVIGGLVGLVVCLEARSFFSARAQGIRDPRYLVARRELSAGQAVHFLDFTFSHQQNVAKGALSDQDLPLLRGATLNRTVKEGEILCIDALQRPFDSTALGASIPRGLRAYPIRPSNSLSVRRGDRVDVLLEPESPSEMPFALLEGPLVLQVDVDADSRGSEEVVLALSSDDIQLLEKAHQRGKLTIALRNPSDEAPAAGRQTRHHLWRSAKRRPQIEILSEGE